MIILKPLLPLKINSLKIKTAGNKIFFEDFSFKEEPKNYLTRYLTPERNSRLESELPVNDLWELKWKADIDSSAIPWFLLIKNDRIIIQNESGWQLFDTSGKLINSGIRSEGEIKISQSKDIFYVNDPSGFIQTINLTTGKREYYFYPYLGKGFERSVIFSNGNKIVNFGFELPVMTHNSPIKIPEMNILEEIKIGSSTEIDEDGVLNTSVENNNLLIKSDKINFALHDSTVVFAIPNQIYFLAPDLEVIKELTGDFIPLAMSLDEKMRIYLIADIEIENRFQTEFWIVDPEGNLICRTEIPSIEYNFLTPPAIDITHTVYIPYKNKIIAVSSSGEILWEEYIQQPLGGIAAINNYLFVSEGSILTAIDHKGERRFFYNFDDDLFTSPILVNNQIFVATRKHLYCLIPKK